jgi:enoyl-CoA hydratase/carnithine racemase
MTFTDILFDVSDGIATITLHRPDALNAFTNQMVRDLKVAFDEVDGNDDIRALVMTGSGRAFCAGADLSSGGKTFEKGGSDITDKGGVVRDGGGATIALADLVDLCRAEEQCDVGLLPPIFSLRSPCLRA